jgi:hypothetical protein
VIYYGVAWIFILDKISYRTHLGEVSKTKAGELEEGREKGEREREREREALRAARRINIFAKELMEREN